MAYLIQLDDLLGVDDSIYLHEVILILLGVTFFIYWVYIYFTEETGTLVAVILNDAARCLTFAIHISARMLHQLSRGAWKTLKILRLAFGSLYLVLMRAYIKITDIISYSKRLCHAVSTVDAVQDDKQRLQTEVRRLKRDAATKDRNLTTVTAERNAFEQCIEEGWDRPRLYKAFPHLKPTKWNSEQHCPWGCGRSAEKYERMMRNERAKATRERDQARSREQVLLTRLEQQKPNAVCSECPKLRKEKDDAVAEKMGANATIERLSKELEQSTLGATCFNCATLRKEKGDAEEESARLRTEVEQAKKPIVCPECPHLREQIANLETARQQSASVQEAATQTTQQPSATKDAAMQTTEVVYGADVYADLQRKVSEADNYARSKQGALQRADWDRVYFGAQLKYISGLLRKKMENPERMEEIERKSKIAGNDAVVEFQKEQDRRKAEAEAERQRRAHGNY